MSQQQSYTPPAMWEENVPEDELAYEGYLQRWPIYPPILAVMQPVHRIHDINCCQRCVML